MECSTAQAGDAEWPQQVEHEHVNQGHRSGQPIDRLLTWQPQSRAHVRLFQYLLLSELFRHFVLYVLKFLARKFGGIDAPRNLAIEIAPNHAAERNSQHDPECDPGETVELERRV